MPPIFRLVLSIFLGVLASSIVLALVNLLRKVIYPVAAVAESLKESLSAVPPDTWWLMLTGYAACAITGSWLTARIAPKGNRFPGAMFTGFLLLLCAVFYFILVDYPWWFSLSACLILPGFGAFGAWLGSGSEGSTSAGS